MGIPTVHVFTHDSFSLGQDGPTHQPVEQLASLRAMPGIIVFRPCDANEVVAMWRVIMNNRDEPSVVALSRQPLATLDRSVMAPADGLRFGAYVLVDAPDGEPDVIVMATGSEVHLALSARDDLASQGVSSRVVSMPCTELFDRQTVEYRDSVLPPHITARVAIEQASSFGWHRYVGDRGAVVGMDHFGASAPMQPLQDAFGFTTDHVVAVVRENAANWSVHS
jgi:transketolase